MHDRFDYVEKCPMCLQYIRIVDFIELNVKNCGGGVQEASFDARIE